MRIQIIGLLLVGLVVSAAWLVILRLKGVPVLVLVLYGLLLLGLLGWRHRVLALAAGGDGSVILLPTPGHSPGHMCVLLRMDAGNVLFIGDTLYTVPHLAVDQVRQMTIGGVDTVHQVEAARRIQSLLAAEPDTVPLFAHDNTRYQHDLVASVFSGRRPGAAGFRRLRQHLATVLTPDWRLRPGHTPSFVAADEGPGRVEFR